MLKKLKRTIEGYKLTAFTNIEVLSNELVISADKSPGYILVREVVLINDLIDTDIYHVKYLENNTIKIKVLVEDV